MSAERRAAKLLEVVAAYEREQCKGLLDAARAEARGIVGEAYATARQRLRTACEHERERLHAVVAAADARLATQRRLQHQRAARAALDEAWGRLRRALAARWQEPAARGMWVTRHLDEARAALPASGWEIRHPADWPADERARVAQALVESGIGEARFASDESIRAGLAVRAGNNVLDATLEGLLADRAATEGRLLAHLEGGDAS